MPTTLVSTFSTNACHFAIATSITSLGSQHSVGFFQWQHSETCDTVSVRSVVSCCSNFRDDGLTSPFLRRTRAFIPKFNFHETLLCSPGRDIQLLMHLLTWLCMSSAISSDKEIKMQIAIWRLPHPLSPQYVLLHATPAAAFDPAYRS